MERDREALDALSSEERQQAYRKLKPRTTVKPDGGLGDESVLCDTGVVS
jgi:hypothetical protein